MKNLILICCSIIVQQMYCNPLTISKNGPRLLIVTYGNGGHYAVADGLIKKLKNYFAIDLVDMEQNPISRFFVTGVYGNAAKHNLGAIAMHLGLFFSSLYDRNAAGWLMWKLGGPQIDLSSYKLIIMTCPFNEFLSTASSLGIPVVQIVTDVEDIGMWSPNRPIVQMLGTDRLFKQFACPHKLHLSGMVCRSELENIRSISKEEMKRKLGLPDRVILVSFGSIGCRSIWDIASMFSKVTDKHFVFACGNDSELKARLAKLNYPHFTILGYTNKLYEYVRAADVMVCRSGTTGIIEAIQCETPMIIKSGWEVMPQEKGSLGLVQQKQYGVIIQDYVQLPEAVNKALSQKYEFPLNNALNEVVHFIMRQCKCTDKLKKRIYE